MVTSMPIPLNEENLGLLSGEVTVPCYDRSKLTPGILHVGVGNFRRAHMAGYFDRPLAMGEGQKWAIVGAGVLPADNTMRDKLQSQDWLTSVIELDLWPSAPGSLVR